MTEYKLGIAIGFFLVSTCAAYDLFFVATAVSIRYFNMSNPDDRGTSIHLKDLSTVVAIDYDPIEDRVYWTDVARHTISRARINGADQEVIIPDISVADGLTIDVKSRMMYWTDTGKNTIERSKLDGKEREVLISEELDEPRAIVIDNENRKMYWTDWGPSIRRIQRANLDGTQREVLVNSTLTNPFGLTLDFTLRRMYWAEAWLDNFESSDMDGDNRTLLYHEDGVNPFSIAFHDEYLYWSDWNKRNVQRIDRFRVNNSTEVLLSLGYRMTTVKAIEKDGKRMLLVGDYFEMRELDLDVEGDLGKLINISNERSLPIAIDYSPTNDLIYWGDLSTESIRTIYRNGSGEKVILANTSYPRGLAISPETNELFWADEKLKVIERATLSGSERKVIIAEDIDSPSGIAVDIDRRHIYWVDYNLGKIERTSYTGEDRYVVLKGLSLPVALALDTKEQLMYWSEFGTSAIKESDLEGNNINQIMSTVNAMGLTVLGDYVYWNDYEKNYTGQINRRTGGDVSVLLRQDRFMGIRIIHNVACHSNPCMYGVTCVPTSYGYTCECALGFSGTNCETIELHIETIQPVIGPVAGGTNITVTGRDFPTIPVQLTIGSLAECQTLISNSSLIVAMTPPVNETNAEDKNQIAVTFPTYNLSIPTEYMFTYKANPSVVSVYPLETLQRGGVSLTVTGSNFDAVEKPMLKVDRVLQTIEIQGNVTRVINETVFTYYERCDKLNSSELLCITPNMGDFNATSWQTNIIQPGRRRRDIGIVKLDANNGWITRAKASLGSWLSPRSYQQETHVRIKRETTIKIIQTIYIGIVLDGVKKFDNLSANTETKDYGKLTIIEPPSFIASNDEIKFVPNQNLDIKGKDVDKLSLRDYRVDVGEGQCDIKGMTSDTIYCMPPQKEPDRRGRSRTEGHTIVIHVGQNIQLLVGTLIYPLSMFLYIGIGAGAALLVVVLIVVTVICVRRKNAAKRRAEQQTGVTSNQESNSTSTIILAPVRPEF